MNQDSFFNKRDFYSLIGIIVFALCIRIIGLGHEPLWIDEAYSVWFSDQNWSYLWTKVPEFETHPPFYYSILKMWRAMFGSSEDNLRLLSVVPSVLIIPLIYLSARLIDQSEQGRIFALLAALLAAGWPFQIHHAQEVRPYAFLAFAMSFTMLCLIWIIQNPARLRVFPLKNLKKDVQALLSMLGLSVGLALLPWLHNLGIITNILVGALLLVWWGRTCRFNFDIFKSLLTMAAFSLLLYAPNISNFLSQTRMVSDGFWLEAPSARDLANSIVLLYGLPLWEILGPFFLWANLIASIVALIIGLIGVRLICLSQNNKESGKTLFWVLAILLLGPTLISLVITYTHRPVFLPRTLILVQVPLMIILAAVPWAFPKYIKNILIGGICIGAITVGPFYQIIKLSREVSHDRTYPVIIHAISQSEYAGAPILIVPNSSALPVTYYQKRLGISLSLHPLPQIFPARDDSYHYPSGGLGVPAITISSIEKVLQNIEPTQVIWAIIRRKDLFDPNGHINGALSEKWPCKKIIIGDEEKRLSLIRYSIKDVCHTE